MQLKNLSKIRSKVEGRTVDNTIESIQSSYAIGGSIRGGDDEPNERWGNANSREKWWDQYVDLGKEGKGNFDN